MVLICTKSPSPGGILCRLQLCLQEASLAQHFERNQKKAMTWYYETHSHSQALNEHQHLRPMATPKNKPFDFFVGPWSDGPDKDPCLQDHIVLTSRQGSFQTPWIIHEQSTGIRKRHLETERDIRCDRFSSWRFTSNTGMPQDHISTITKQGWGNGPWAYSLW